MAHDDRERREIQERGTEEEQKERDKLRSRHQAHKTTQIKANQQQWGLC